MYHYASPYIIPHEQMSAAEALAGLVESRPDDLCISDYSLFTTMFWHEEPGSPEARQHFYNKLQEELSEVDEELDKLPIEPDKTIEEYGDASFCVFALGNACRLDTTIFIKDLWARQGVAGIRCRADSDGPPYVQSVVRSGVISSYRATRFGRTLLQQPYVYDFPLGEDYQAHRAYQVDTIGHALSQPISRMSQMAVGYTLADIWLGETKRVSEALGDEQVMALGMANNMPKMISRVEAARK